MGHAHACPDPVGLRGDCRLGRGRDDDDALTVHFTTGSPECFGVHPMAHETPEAVTVELVGGSLPEATGRACVMIAVFGAHDVPLESPLGDREVLSEF